MGIMAKKPKSIVKLINIKLGASIGAFIKNGTGLIDVVRQKVYVDSIEYIVPENEQLLIRMRLAGLKQEDYDLILNKNSKVTLKLKSKVDRRYS